MTTWTIQKEVSIYDVVEMFKKADRDNFTQEALEYIMNDLQDLMAIDENGNVLAFDLDIIAICSEWTEASVKEVYNDYYHNFELSEYIIGEDDLPFYDEETGEFSENYEDLFNAMSDEEWEYHFDSQAFLEDLQNSTHAVQLDNGNILYQNF